MQRKRAAKQQPDDRRYIIIFEDMSEKQKQVEKERKAVLQLLLEKTGLKYKEVVDAQIGIWMAGNLDLLSAEQKKQFPHLVF